MRPLVPAGIFSLTARCLKTRVGPPVRFPPEGSGAPEIHLPIHETNKQTRRFRWQSCCLLLLAGTSLLLSGCLGSSSSNGELELVWGRQGLSSGRFQKPRAVAIDASDHLYIVDMTARIQVFDREGTFLNSWQTPTHENGRPCGLTIARDGNLLVADTHYYQMLVYKPDGSLLQGRTIGGKPGPKPGDFGFVTDAIEDSQGNFYIAEYGDNDRIQKFSPTGNFLLQWGGHGRQPGEFIRPQNLAIDAQDRIWVADACNHRIQVFDSSGKLLKLWGESGNKRGQLYYPYDLVLDGLGHLYICEYGNHRVQKFDLEGKSLGCWGSHGRGPGKLHNPWAICRDSKGKIHVIDSMNHRVQRIDL